MNKKNIFLLCVFCALFGNLFPADPLPLSQVKYWCYQIQDLDSPGAIDTIVNSKYDMVVIDPMVTHDFTFDTKTVDHTNNRNNQSLAFSFFR